MRAEPFAAIVLDLGLPGLTGLELLRSERARGNKVPVLILTARDAVQDRINAGMSVAASIARPGTQAPRERAGLGLSIVQRIVDCIAAACNSTRHRQVSGCELW